MAVVNFVLIILFIYLIVYCIYLLTMNIKSFSSKDFLNEQKYNQQMNLSQNRLCVIVWASSKHKYLHELLHSLNVQTYPSTHFEVHVILVRDSENVPLLPDNSHMAHIHNIENPDFFSQDKAVTTFIERLIPENNFDAFVFLGADRVVKENYLECVNKNITGSCILTGKLKIRCRSKSFYQKLKCGALQARQKFVNNTLEITRRMFELCTTIDSDNCVITADILEKTGRVCFETRNDELKYSLFLASNQLKPTYCPFIESFVDVENYDASYPSLSQSYAMLKYYIPLLAKKPWYFTEYVLAILRPSLLFAVAAYLVVLFCTFNFLSTIPLKYVLHLGIFYFINILSGIVSARLNLREIFLLACYPFVILGLRYKVASKNISLRAIKKQIEEDDNINSATVNALVTDGKKDLICKLDLVSEDGMRRVVFRFNKKRFISDAHLRMFDAMTDITKRLIDKGFTLKVCQNCAFFKPNPDGTVDLLKGLCFYNVNPQEPNEADVRQTLIWNTCPVYKKLEFEQIIKGQ